MRGRFKGFCPSDNKEGLPLCLPLAAASSDEALLAEALRLRYEVDGMTAGAASWARSPGRLAGLPLCLANLAVWYPIGAVPTLPGFARLLLSGVLHGVCHIARHVHPHGVSSPVYAADTMKQGENRRLGETCNEGVRGSSPPASSRKLPPLTWANVKRHSRFGGQRASGQQPSLVSVNQTVEGLTPSRPASRLQRRVPKRSSRPVACEGWLACFPSAESAVRPMATAATTANPAPSSADDTPNLIPGQRRT
jgi:hypothetical protein